MKTVNSQMLYSMYIAPVSIAFSPHPSVKLIAVISALTHKHFIFKMFVCQGRNHNYFIT